MTMARLPSDRVLRSAVRACDGDWKRATEFAICQIRRRVEAERLVFIVETWTRTEQFSLGAATKRWRCSAHPKRNAQLNGARQSG